MGPVLPAGAHAGLRALAVLVCALLVRSNDRQHSSQDQKKMAGETRPSSFQQPDLSDITLRQTSLAGSSARLVRALHSPISLAARTASACLFSSPMCERASHQNTGPCADNEVSWRRVPRAAPAESSMNFLIWRVEPARAERIGARSAGLGRVAFVACAARFNAEQVDRAVLVLKAPAPRIGQVGRLRAIAIDPPKCTLARVCRVLESCRDDRARAFVETLRTAPAHTDDAIHVLVPLEKSGPPLATANSIVRQCSTCAQTNALTARLETPNSSLRCGECKTKKQATLVFALRNCCAVRSDPGAETKTSSLGSGDTVHSPLGERGSQRCRFEGLVQH